MRPILRLAHNTLAGRPGRTVLMVGAVALAASLVVAVSCAIGSVQASMLHSIQKILGAADARVIHPGNGRFDETLLATVRSWPEVEAATGRLLGSLTLVHADLRRDPKTGELLRATPSVIGVDFALDRRFRASELAAGRQPASPAEILIDPITAEELQAAVGDRLQVQRFGEPIDLMVAGIYQRERLGAVQRPLIEMDRQAVAEAMDRTGQLTSIVIILKAGNDVEKFCERHAAELPQSLLLEPAEKIRAGFDRQVRGSRFGFIIASMLTFTGASFIIVAALTTAVTERQREMAIVRCMGASRGQLFASQLVLGVVLGGVGGALGLPLGIGLTAILVWYFGELLPAGLHVESFGIQLALIGSMVAGLLGAIYPAWMASRVSPLEAMTWQARPPRMASLVLCALAGAVFIGAQLVLMLPNDPQTRFVAYAYAGLPAAHIGYFLLAIPMLAIMALVLSRPIAVLLRLPPEMVRRTTMAAPFRNGFTAGALTVGVAVLVTTWSVASSLMEDWLGKIKFADAFAYRTTGISPAEQQAIAALPFVKVVCTIGYLPVQLYGRQIFGIEGIAPPNVLCIGFDPDVFFSINAVEWIAGDPPTAIERLKDGSGVIVAERFLITQRVKIGDTLKLGVGRMQREFEIVGAVNSAGLDIATHFFGIRSQYMEFSISCVFADFRTIERAFDNHDAYMMQINLAEHVDDEEAIRRVAEVAPGVQFYSGRWIMEMINSIAVAMLVVQSTVAFAALVLASVGVGNVIAANVHSRRYEYGVLRAIGAQRSFPVRLILAEAALLAAAGALTGTLLGLHLAWVGAFHYRDLAGLPVRVHFPAVPTASGWLVLLGLTLLAALPGALGVRKRQPSELLAAGRSG